jgi:hypothetical protein
LHISEIVKSLKIAEIFQQFAILFQFFGAEELQKNWVGKIGVRQLGVRVEQEIAEEREGRGVTTDGQGMDTVRMGVE